MAEQEHAAGTAAAAAEAAAPASETPLFDKMTAKRRLESSEKTEIAGYLKTLLDQVQKGARIVPGNVERTVKAMQEGIDRQISQQLNQVMHSEKFQKLESTWRGLHYLVKNSAIGTDLKVRVLNTTKDELLADFNRATDYDQSTLFKKVYTAEFGQFGGNPYGMLVGDYYFGYKPEDVQLLRQMSGVAAAAHAPFIAAAGPQMFGFESFEELPKPRDLAVNFEQPDYIAWKGFRESEDSRYVALVMPRVLSRLPYGPDTTKVAEFNFAEDVDGRDHSKYLWMNAAWAYAVRCTNAYSEDGWLMRTRGPEGGGKVDQLPVHTFKVGGAKEMKCPTEVLISDTRELELSNLGFLPLAHCKNTEYAAFFGAQSCQKPQKYFAADANANAELSTKINYLMSVARFSHYLKVMARNWVGTFMEVDDLKRKLNDWINNYTLGNPEDASQETRAKKPLRNARIDIEKDPARPGWYRAVAYLRPHFQMEGLEASMRLVAEVPTKKG
jgi:type VI secretion system protein ImpC